LFNRRFVFVTVIVRSAHKYLFTTNGNSTKGQKQSLKGIEMYASKCSNKKKRVLVVLVF